MIYLPLETVGADHIGYQQQVKEANIKRIYDLVRTGKCKSRAEIVRFMNLSATSVSVLVEELAARGLITETGPTMTALPGRRPISLRLNSDAHQIAVFSARRDGVRFALLNMECDLLDSRFFPLDVYGLTDEAAGLRYAALFEEVLRRSRKFDAKKALVVAFSFPGVYAEADEAFHTRLTLGVDVPIAPLKRFQDRVRLPIYLCYAPRGMAYGEKTHLEALNPDSPDAQDLIFVEIRDAISCAIISGGNVYTGPYNVAGVIGHMTIDHNGLPCPCGNTGCLERYVNLNAVLEDARKAALAAGVEPPECLEALVRRYPRESALLESVKNSARLLAFGLYSVLCSSGMRRVVLGGGIEQLGDIFLQEVYRALLSRTRLIHHLDLSYAQAGPDAEFVGIAQHFLDKVYTITM